MDWSYEGPSGPTNWNQIYGDACGSKQSPINIPISKLKLCDSYNIPKIHIRYTNDLDVLQNIGYFWSLTGENIHSYVYGGPMNGRYELGCIHAHWREPTQLGSEHALNGEFFDSEFHLVHWNRNSYGTVEEALNHADGLVVFGIMARIGEPHPEIQKIVDKLPKISYNGLSTEIEDFDATTLLTNTKSYWSYLGSLTTPPCAECVRWIVFDEPIEISEKQLASFRSIHCHMQGASRNLIFSDKVLKNARPLHPLAGRDIIRVGKI